MNNNVCVKHDDGKPKWSYLLQSALLPMVRVMEYGAKKYSHTILSKEGIKTFIKRYNEDMDCSIVPIELMKPNLKTKKQTLRITISNGIEIKHTILDIDLQYAKKSLMENLAKAASRNVIGIEMYPEVIETISGKWQFTNGMNITTICDALKRHLDAFIEGEDNDPESGLSHIGHIQANAMFLAYTMEHHREMDDRFSQHDKRYYGKFEEDTSDDSYSVPQPKNAVEKKGNTELHRCNELRNSN